MSNLIHVMVVAALARDRSVVRRLVWPEPDITVAGEAANYAEAVDSLCVHWYDAMVLDLSSADPQSLGLLTRLAREFPQVPVIGLVDAGTQDARSAALQCGACSVVVWDAVASHLVPAIRKAAVQRWDRDLASPAPPLLPGMPTADAAGVLRKA
jgi:DNA-binding NarL/FixJ family response regulator